jgi:CO/xanthine dehydrogenase Mo-binding subunit
VADLAGANGLREHFRVVGKPNLPGKTSYVMATGIAKYGVDFTLPDMLHAAFLRSPYANARVVRIGDARARALPGVVDILTWEDEEIKALQSYGEVFGHPRPFLDDIADQEGAEVGAVVVAESYDICEEALRLLDVEWEVLPHVVDLHEGRREDAPVIRPGENFQPEFSGVGADGAPPKRGNVYTSILVFGDPDAGFAEADHVCEYDLRLPPFACSMPNPSGSVAWWSKDFYQGEGDNLHIEGAVREKDAISRMYGMPPDKTIQQGLFMGGKYCDWGLRKAQEITPLLARRTGRPVRCVNKRADTYDFIMTERLIHMKLGFTDDGLITAMDDFSIADGGVRSSSTFGNVGDLKQGPYNTIKCKNIREVMEVVDSNRGMMYVSGQHCPFNWDTVTTAIYLISEKLDMDPIEVARRNLHGPESKDDPNPVPSFDLCIEAGRRLMDWQPHRAGAKTLPDGRLHGASFRYQMSPRHSFVDYHAKLEYRDGVVRMPTQGPIFGAYVIEANAMVAAEELGLEYEDIVVDLDTREPFKAYGGGSDGTTASCWATKECANILKRRILEAAIRYAENPAKPGFHGPPPPEPGPFAGMQPDELDLADGRVVIKADPSKGVPIAQATNENLFATFVGKPPLALWVTGGMGGKLDTMNTAYCEVAVDTETGEVEILRFGVAADVGKIMRLTSLESQIDQVMYFSAGCQLLEDYFYDPRTGVRLNNNMVEYKKPGMLDAPPVERVFPESRMGNAAYGANGISHSLANTNLVIIAIHNATGVWVEPPATPDKVLEALGKI